MAGRGGHRLGAGRRRRQVQPSPNPASSEILKFAEAVFKGIALSALPLAPDANDEELVEIGLSDLVLNEIKRGRGGEILRLTGNIVSMLSSLQTSAEAGSGSTLADALGSMPGMDDVRAPSVKVKAEVVASRRTVRELGCILNSEKAQSLAPRQSELFDATPVPGVSLN